MSLSLGELQKTPQVKMEDHTEEQSEPSQSDGEESGSSPTAGSPEMDNDTLPNTTHPSPVSATASTSPNSPTSPTSSTSSSYPSNLSHSHSSTDRPSSKLATTLRPSPHYPRASSPAPVIQPRLRTRGLGLTPLTSNTGNTCHPLLPLGTGNLPKAQPLARALFAKMANGHDTPHAGMGGKKKSGAQKMIVPTKGFKTRFELSLSSSELARQ